MIASSPPVRSTYSHEISCHLSKFNYVSLCFFIPLDVTCKSYLGWKAPSIAGSPFFWCTYAPNTLKSKNQFKGLYSWSKDSFFFPPPVEIHTNSIIRIDPVETKKVPFSSSAMLHSCSTWFSQMFFVLNCHGISQYFKYKTVLQNNPAADLMTASRIYLDFMAKDYWTKLCKKNICTYFSWDNSYDLYALWSGRHLERLVEEQLNGIFEKAHRWWSTGYCFLPARERGMNSHTLNKELEYRAWSISE